MKSLSTLGFVFPGQGSQSLGMLKALADTYPIVQEVFAEASEVLDFDAWQLAQEGPEAQLNQTEFTQPVLLAADIAVWRVWQQLKGPLPAYLAGHSLGEFAALVVADVLTFKDAVKLVELRGRYMQHAVAEGEGAMAAIVGLEDIAVATICKQATSDDAVVSPANYNSIGQVVIAGHRAAVERAIDLAKEQKAKIAKLIPVSVPSHCLLMKAAAEQLAAALESIVLSVPRLPVIHNATVTTAENGDSIRQQLVQQLTQPVRWVETIQFMQQQGIQSIVECGPGTVLFGLIRRISKDVTPYRADSPEQLDKTLTAIQQAHTT